MSIKFGDAADNTWKRIRLQHVTLVAGLALAVSSAVAVGGWQGDGSPAPSLSSPSRSGGGASARSADAHQVVVYLVASQEQVDRAAYVENAVAAEFGSVQASYLSRTVHVLLARTLEQQAEAEYFIAEQSRGAIGVTFSYIDLR